MNAEAFDVINRAGQADNFDLATVAGASIDLANVEGAAEDFVDAIPNLFSELIGGIL